MTTDGSLRSSYRDQLAQLRSTVLQLGAFAGDMLDRALQALATRNVQLAREVHRSDDVADDLDYQIERQSIAMLASQQPVSRDLRAILGALRIATDLERIADYAKDVAKQAIALGEQPPALPVEGIVQMGARAGELLRLALQAFADQDLEAARQVAARDEELDEMWHDLAAQLKERMRNEPESVNLATSMILMARYLERIGDHTVNILERLHYMETGKLEALT